MNTTDPGQPGETPAQALARAAEQAKRLIDEPTASTEVVPVGRGADVAKQQMAGRHSELLRAQIDLEQAAKDMRNEIERETQRMRNEMYAKLEALKPLQVQIAQLKEGIWTVNLYLGRDETIVPLRGGEPAPAATPISIRQMVLSMDEETALEAVGGGIDFTDIERFDEWLLADPKNLDQVLPETRGVVVLVPRRRGRNYGIGRESLNKHNTKSYWLIRNGERLFRMHTDVELETGGPTYNVGDTLMPRRDEFVDLYWHDKYDYTTHETHRVPMEPGSREWLEAEQKQDAKRRHYMRSALILQGLIDRTSVFDPKPAEHVSTLSLESYDAGHVVLINDAEDSLQLTTGREGFYEYLARLNKQLRVGMRIVGAFDAAAWTSMRSWEDGHRRLYPHRAEDPQALTIHYLDGRKDGGFVFHYDRNEGVYDPSIFVESANKPGWGRYGAERRAKRRASATIEPGDPFVIPFDLVDVATLRTYMEARLERHAYLDLFPLFEAVIDMKNAEAEAEAPMRELLVGALVAAGVDREDAELEMPSLVDWWKLTNRHHRPLVSLDHEAEAKAVKAIVAEYRHRQQAIADADRDADMVKHFRGLPGVDAVLVAQARDGRWMVFTRQEHDLDEASVPAKTFVTHYVYSRTGAPREVNQWVLPGVRANKWRVVWSHEDWATWDFGATPSTHLTGPEIRQYAAQAADSLTRMAADQGRGRGSANPEPGSLLAVEYRHNRSMHERGGWTAWLLPDDPQDQGYHNAPLLRLRASWKRTTGGQLAVTFVEYLERDSIEFHHNFKDLSVADEMPNRKGLVMYDVAVMERLDQYQAARKVQREADQKVWQRLYAAENSVERGWIERREAAEYARFLEDYQDASLWEEHRKRLTIKYPHWTSHSASTSPLGSMLRRLHAAGARLDGYTVGQLAELDRGRGGDYTPPEDIADIKVVDRPGGED